MSRLPVPGSDSGVWGNVLNDFLGVEHNTDGSLKASGSLSTKQARSDNLTAIANLTPSDDDILQRKSGAWANRTLSQVKSDLSLNNVDNTSDANKPVSTAQQTALNGKVDTTGGGKEQTASSTATTGSTTINLANGNVQQLTLNISTTLTLTGATASTACSLSLYIVQDGTGGRTVTWPAAVKWPSAIPPTLSSGGSKVDLVILETLDGGTTWYGTFAGADFR
jgi:hypothetical protein